MLHIESCLFLYLRTSENILKKIFCNRLLNFFQIPMPLFSSILRDSPIEEVQFWPQRL